MTEVKFVKDRSGEFKGSITAVFPYEIATLKGEMTCYCTIGAHAACSIDWVSKCTIPAKPEEYADLLKELILIGYDDLKIIKRIQHKKYLKAYYKLLEDRK